MWYKIVGVDYLVLCFSSEIDFHARFAVNQSRPEDITMREEVACMPFVGDDGFGRYIQSYCKVNF